MITIPSMKAQRRYNLFYQQQQKSAPFYTEREIEKLSIEVVLHPLESELYIMQKGNANGGLIWEFILY